MQTLSTVTPQTAATRSSTTEPWSIAEIPQHFDRITALADRAGYLACVFGSTLRDGVGRDLDVVMISRGGVDQYWGGFLELFGGDLVRKLERPEKGNHSYEVAKDGRLFHFIFGRF